MVKSDWLKLVLCLLFTLGIGLVGGLFTAPQIQTWYVSLNKPTFNPPNWIFAPVWSTLYILMGISLFLII
ncbi:MAG: TspO/MBR family protein, partial [Sediminibacterium sp.]